MPIPTTLDELSTTPGDNFPGGSELPTTADDYLRAHASLIATLRDQAPTLGTAVNASGTSVDFTGIPSWAKRITLNFSGVSTNGVSNLLIQIGDSGGIEATGYSCVGGNVVTASTAVTSYTTGFGIPSGAASNVMGGSIVLSLLNAANNTWTANGAVSSPPTNIFSVAGAKSLSAALDRVRLTTDGGVNTFDAGSVNVLYE